VAALTEMSVTFSCLRCGKPIAVDAGQPGQQVECPYCQGDCLIPPPRQRGVPAPAQFQCNNAKCGSVWFEHQLRHEQYEEKPVNLCPHCRWGVTRIVSVPSFWDRVPGAFVYPWLGDGPWMVGLGTVLFALLDLANRFGFGIGSLFAAIMSIGYFGMFGLDVIRISAQDDDRQMDWPDLGGWADIIAGAFQVFVSGLLVFGAAIICAIMAGRALIWGTEMAAITWGGFGVGLTLLAILYYPMAMLAVAMFDTVTATDPRVVVPAIVRVPLQYAFVLMLLLFLWVLRHGAMRALMLLPFGWQFLGFLPVSLMSFYTLIVSCRLLGILYRANEKKLGWFR